MLTQDTRAASRGKDSRENSPCQSPSALSAHLLPSSMDTAATESVGYVGVGCDRRASAAAETVPARGGTKIKLVSLDCGLGVHSTLPCTRERARHIVAWLHGCAFPHGVTASRGLLDLVVLQNVHTEVAQQELISGISRSLDLRHLLTAVGSRSMGSVSKRSLLAFVIRNASLVPLPNEKVPIVQTDTRKI